MTDSVSGRVGSAETGSRASMEPSCTVSTLTGFDPARGDALDDLFQILDEQLAERALGDPRLDWEK